MRLHGRNMAIFVDEFRSSTLLTPGPPSPRSPPPGPAARGAIRRWPFLRRAPQANDDDDEKIIMMLMMRVRGESIRRRARLRASAGRRARRGGEGGARIGGRRTPLARGRRRDGVWCAGGNMWRLASARFRKWPARDLGLRGSGGAQVRLQKERPRRICLFIVRSGSAPLHEPLDCQAGHPTGAQLTWFGSVPVP
eukprot:scaffold700_cov560-Prasinococcus_capsulatus_cf.AAC.4